MHQTEGPLVFSVSSERHRQVLGERNCLSFETAVGGIEPSSLRLTARLSTVRPQLPTCIEINTKQLGKFTFTSLDDMLLRRSARV